MKDVTVFRFENKNVRTIQRDGETWFVAADVCACLGYADAADAVRNHCKNSKSLKELTSGVWPEPFGVGPESLPFNSLAIKESDVYRLTMRSRLDSAQVFQDWVCEEVLPAIRRTGEFRLKSSPRRVTKADALNDALKEIIRLQTESARLLSEVFELRISRLESEHKRAIAELPVKIVHVERSSNTHEDLGYRGK